MHNELEPVSRINNGLDREVEPFDAKEIVERAFSAIFNRSCSRLLQCYNVLTNNCEHFATWARNGWAVSEQVRQTPFESQLTLSDHFSVVYR